MSSQTERRVGAVIFVCFLAIAFIVVVTFMVINNEGECKMPQKHTSCPETLIQYYRRKNRRDPTYKSAHSFRNGVHSVAERHISAYGKLKQHHPESSMLAWRWLRLVLYDMGHDGTLGLDCTPWKDASHVHDAELHEWFTRRVAAARHRFKFTQIRAVEFACAQVQVVTFREWLPVMFSEETLKFETEHACFNKTESWVLKKEFLIASGYLQDWIAKETEKRDLGSHGPLFGPKWGVCDAADLGERLKKDREETSYTELRWTVDGMANDGLDQEWEAGAVDLWDGLAGENYDPRTAALPPTLTYMLMEHLKRARAGDPNFYAWNPSWVKPGYLTELHLSRYDQGVEFTASLAD